MENAGIDEIKNNYKIFFHSIILFTERFDIENWRDTNSKRKVYAVKKSLKIWDVPVDNIVIWNWLKEKLTLRVWLDI